jgi:ATP-dependent Zn protease
LGDEPQNRPGVFGQRKNWSSWAREHREQRDYSEERSETIDEEVHEIVSTAYERALRSCARTAISTMRWPNG